MVRRVIEEEVSTPTITVVEDDGSWVGRTIVLLVVVAILVVAAVWLVHTVSDNDHTTNIPGNRPGGVVPTAQVS